MSTVQRQRPKLANYQDRHTAVNDAKSKPSKPNLAVPKKAPAPGTVDSKRVRHASSGKPIGSGPAAKVDESAGKMTKFKSLDDIPDISEDYVPSFHHCDDNAFGDYGHDEDDYHQPVRETRDEYSHQYYRQQSPQLSSEPPPLPAERRYHPREVEEDEYYNDDCDYGPQYGADEDDFDYVSDDSEPEATPYRPPPRGQVGKAAATGGERQEGRVVRAQPRGGRQPSPIVYDESAAPAGARRGKGNDGKPLSEEEKLYFDRQPRDVAYKPYTLKEYRKINPQAYVELGKLQPDLNTDELVAKRANAERIKEFSKNLKDFNRQAIPRKESGEVGGPSRRQQEESKRDKAKKFAQNIPKPKVKLESEPKNIGAGTLVTRSNVGMSGNSAEANRLDELTSKHMQSRKQVDAIKKSLGL